MGISGARVLLVEDNEINQQVALEILQGAGLSVTVANNGQEGVDAAMQTQYDAILMDIQMPVMDGYAATREIRNWEVGNMNPIIFHRYNPEFRLPNSAFRLIHLMGFGLSF